MSLLSWTFSVERSESSLYTNRILTGGATTTAGGGANAMRGL